MRMKKLVQVAVVLALGISLVIPMSAFAVVTDAEQAPQQVEQNDRGFFEVVASAWKAILTGIFGPQGNAGDQSGLTDGSDGDVGAELDPNGAPRQGGS